MDSKKTYKNETFNTADLAKEAEFSNYDSITFIGCTFKGEVSFKPNSNLRFSNCTFENEWKHVICEKIVYSKCTFDQFGYYNISKEKDISKDSTLFDCTFNSIDCEGIIFEKLFIQIVDENKQRHINDIRLIRCEFKDDFILNVTDNSDRDKLIEVKFNSVDFTDSTFHKKFKMQYCSVENKSIFYNTKFKDLSDFYRTKFNEVVFERTDFEKIAVFSEAEFNQDLDFKYTKFLGKSIFRDTVIKGKLNLRNTIFDEEANFLDITSEERKKDENEEFIGDTKDINVTNRETARIIKNFFDKSGNLIEANKFYALEMQKRKEELSKKGNILKLLVFYFHSISSEHSQNWFLALLWILFLALFYTISIICKDGIIFIYLVTIFVLVNTMINEFSNNKSMYKQREVIRIIVVALAVSSVCLTPGIQQSCSVFSDEFSKLYLSNLSPFINSKDEILTFSLFIYKVALSYLIYQFIVSVRQNTRRK